MRRGRRGGATTEFVVVFGPAFILLMFVVEVAIAYFFIESLEKAAVQGARLAAVAAPAATGLPTRNPLSRSGAPGQPCSADSAPCVAPSGSVWRCEGGTVGCDGASFTLILSEMQRFVAALEPEHVTIVYTYDGLGYAGGPFVPIVSVEIAGFPQPLGVIGAIRQNFFSGGAIVTAPPVRSVTTGEFI